MTPRRPADLPPLTADVVAVAGGLRAGLGEILGDDLASLFLYGAVAFPRPAQWAIDFDFHALVGRPLDDTDRRAVGALYARLAAASPLGADLDGYLVLLADAGRAEPPPSQLDPTVRDEAWALHRAHIHGGRYFLIAGADPVTIVTEPSWSELAGGLRSELRFVTTHPDAPAFGILNGARILCSFATRDVVLSKYDAARWALATLPAEWHDAIRAASRWYARTANDRDTRTIAAQWAPFVSFVERSTPAASSG